MLRPGILASLAFALTTTASSICPLPQPRLACAEFFHSDAVVIATLVRTRHVVPKGEQDYHLYTFRVNKRLRGQAPDEIVLWDENSSARMSFDLVPKHEYLLFVDRWKWDGQGKENRWWTADGCGNSGPVERRSKTLRKLQDAVHRKGARINGKVLVDNLGYDLGTTVRGAQVVATRTADKHTFQTRTRADGSFDLWIAPGQYSVEVLPRGAYAQEEFSYEVADAVALEDGSCAQIQFVPINSPGAVKKRK